MIARIWKGWTSVRDTDRYAEYITETGIRGLRSTPGNCGAYLLHRPAGDRTEFVVVSFWDGIEGIRAFAGDEVDKAVFYPEDERYLVDREWRVNHYRVARWHSALASGRAHATKAPAGLEHGWGPNWL